MCKLDIDESLDYILDNPIIDETPEEVVLQVNYEKEYLKKLSVRLSNSEKKLEGLNVFHQYMRNGKPIPSVKQLMDILLKHND
jgi:hypothetical protein